MTTDEARYKEFAVQPWQAAEGVRAAVTIDSTRHFQSILGFGGAFTDASCYLLGRMEPAQRRELMKELVGAEGLHLSVGRTCIGASDYSRNAYSFDDSATPDPDLKNFSIAHDRDYILPVLREAIHTNPELYLFSSPWSPPGWMKASHSLLGGNMRKEYFAAYAQYFVKFLEAYRTDGVNISAVTVQNEVDSDQDGRMPAAMWGQEYEMGFIREFLGPALRKTSLDTKIWILDHNYDLWGRALDELSDAGVSQFVDGVAWHGYWTEGGPFISAPDYAADWAMWSGKYAGILKNWARCIVAWNVVLDEKGTPNIGPFDCGGIVTIDSKTQKITRSGQYWAFAHYSKAVRRGARVIASSGSVSGLEHVAFANPEGDYVLVLTNQGEAREIDCRFESKSLHLSLPKNSIVTLQWS